MQDKEYIKELAKKFNNEKSAMIHAEMMDWGKCEICLSGSGVAMLHNVSGIIFRIGQLYGQSFDDTMKAVKEIFEIEQAKKNIPDGGGEEDGEYKEI